MTHLFTENVLSVIGSAINLASFYMVPAIPIVLMIVWFLVVNRDEEPEKSSVDLLP